MMKRRTAVLLGWSAAATAAGMVVALSAALAGERGDQRERYRSAVIDQRRAAGKPAAPREQLVRSGARTACVSGASGFATAASAALGRGARGEGGALDPVALAQVSSAAVEAERWAEQAAAGPALPQRMGKGPDGEKVAPATVACDGAAAFTVAQVVAPGAPAVTAPAAKVPVAAKPAKAAKAR
jgi:hypothetical protein